MKFAYHSVILIAILHFDTASYLYIIATIPLMIIIA